MPPYNPYTNSKGFFNPRVMVTHSVTPSIPVQQSSAPQISTPQMSTPQVSTPQESAPQSNHPRRAEAAHTRPEPRRGLSGEKHHFDTFDTAPGDSSIPGLPARKKSRLEEPDTGSNEASSTGITGVSKHGAISQDVPSCVLKRVLEYQVRGESTAVTVREISNLVLVSKKFRMFFHPELVKEGIRHAARTKNLQLLKHLCSMTETLETLNFPAWNLNHQGACNMSLPPVGAPLHESAGANDPEGVEFLLSAGADPNFLDCRHETALHRAAKTAGPIVFVQLMKAGCNSETRNLHLWTPFDIAIASRNLAIIYSLWRLGQCVDSPRDPTGSSPVHKAIDTNCLATLKLVLAFKPKLNVKDWSGATPLIHSIREGKSPDVMEAIMGLSPNALIKDRAGKTALYYMHVRKDVKARDLFARYYCGSAFNKGLKDAQKKCYRRYETTPMEFSFVYHY